MSDVVRLSDYESSEIFKSFIAKSVEGKVPIRKVVTRRGKTFSQTYWVKPKDFKAFKSTEHAAEFLTRTVDAFNYFSGILANLSKYNEELAVKVYEEMKKAGQSQIELAGRMVQLAEWSGRRESNISDLLTALHVKSQGGKKSLDWKDIEEAYAQISYKYENSGLSIGGEKETKIKVTSELNPENWSEKVGGVAKVIQDVIKRAYGRVKEIFDKRGIKLEEGSTTTEPKAEAKDVEEKPKQLEAKEFEPAKLFQDSKKVDEFAQKVFELYDKNKKTDGTVDFKTLKNKLGEGSVYYVVGKEDTLFSVAALHTILRQMEKKSYSGALNIMGDEYMFIYPKDLEKLSRYGLGDVMFEVGNVLKIKDKASRVGLYKTALENMGLGVYVGELGATDIDKLSVKLKSLIDTGKEYGEFEHSGKKYYYATNLHSDKILFNSVDLSRFLKDYKSGNVDKVVYVIKNGTFCVITPKDKEKISKLTIKQLRNEVDKGVIWREDLEGDEMMKEYKKALESLGFDVEIGKTKEVK